MLPSSNDIFVFGPSGSGKTSLIKKIASSDARVSPKMERTFGVEFTVVTMNAQRVRMCELGGMPEFREPLYLSGMGLGLYCIDLSRIKNISFEEIRRNLLNFKSNNPSAPIWLIGTKADLLTEREAHEAMGGILSQLNDLISDFALTSSWQGIDNFKRGLAQQLAEQNVPTPVENEFEGVDLGDPNKVSPKPTPRSYCRLFPKLQSMNALDDKYVLSGARNLLNDYTKGNTLFFSRLHRYVCGHVNRHYVTEVSAIVKQIDNGGIASFNDLMAALDRIKIANPGGSLARRIDYIRKKVSGWGLDGSEMRDVAEDTADHQDTADHDIVARP